jgi:membrane protein DedA with SNARE-associated domain
MTEWIEQIIQEWGSGGVAFLMFLENLFPPIPSEIVLPLAGYYVAEGDLSLPAALVAGSAGSLIGVTLWYLGARWLGTRGVQRFARDHGRFLTLSPQDIDHVNDWFEKHGRKAVILGRLVPGIRTLISIPAGIFGMPLGRFLIYTAIGTTLWSVLLLLAGYYLGAQFEQVKSYLSPVGDIVLIVLIAWYLYRVVTFRQRVQPADN